MVLTQEQTYKSNGAEEKIPICIGTWYMIKVTPQISGKRMIYLVDGLPVKPLPHTIHKGEFQED